MADEDLAQMRISVQLYYRDDLQSLQFRAVRSTRRPDLLWDLQVIVNICNDFLAAVISACFVGKPIHCYCWQDQGL
jgi:hypothetical protein